MAGTRGVLLAAEDALGGVGGFAGMKNDGMDATVAFFFFPTLSIHAALF
jgi:hypothetical protein